MRKAFNQSLCIGLSYGGICLMHISGWRRKVRRIAASCTLNTEESSLPERIAARLDVLLTEAGCDGLRTAIVLANDMARLFMVTPPSNATSLRDCQAAAVMRLQTLFGVPPAEWQVAADWNADTPFPACAMPRKLLDLVISVADKHALKLIQVTPQFIADWNRWCARLEPDAWFGVAQAGMLTLAAIHQQKLCALRTLVIPAGAASNADWLPWQLQSEALRINLPVPTRIQLCGEVPLSWVVKGNGELSCSRLDEIQALPGIAAHTAEARLAAAGMPA